MAQTPPTAPNPFEPFTAIVEAFIEPWFDAVETVLSAQRQWVRAAIDSPLPLYPIIPPMVQAPDGQRAPTSV